MECNVYFENFKKYEKIICEYQGEDYFEIIDEVKKIIVPKQESDKESSAIVVFGFSGNGKSTWIRNFCEESSDYVILSMDEVVKKLSESLGRPVNGYEITMAFGEKLHEVCSTGKNVVVDGNFLNLLTRSALTDSLHTYGYDVTLMDLTPIFDMTIEKRIFDETSKALGVEITEDNVDEYRRHPTYIAMKKRVLDYHKKERERSAYDEQILLGATSIGVDKVITISNDTKLSTVGVKK